MEFTMTASYENGISETFEDVYVDSNNKLSFRPISHYGRGGTKIESIERVRAILIDALTNPDQYKYFGHYLKLQVYCHHNNEITYHDTLKLQFRR